MTRTKNNKGKKGKGQRKGQKQTQRTEDAKLQFAAAPSAVSSNMRQYVRFPKGNGRSDGITMEACIALAGVGIASSGSAGSVPTMQFAQSATFRDSAQLSLTQLIVSTAGAGSVDGAVSPAWDLISSAFTRFRVKRLVFHYRPQSATSQAGRLVFAFAADPNHPMTWAASPTQNKLLALADSVPFGVWNAWTMDVSHRINKDMLMYTFDVTGNVTDAADRFSSFGSIGCLAETAITPSEEFGVLYMEALVEFVEFDPVTVTRPAMESSSRTAPTVNRTGGRKAFCARTLETGDKAEPQRPPLQGAELSADRVTTKELRQTLKSLASDSWKIERACFGLMDEMRGILQTSNLADVEDDPVAKQNRLRCERALKALEGIADLGEECQGFGQ